jgi:hypothetical protein
MRNGAIPSDFNTPVIRAFGNFDSTMVGTNPPTAGINIASVTRLAPGAYSVLFTTPIFAATYTVLITPDAADRAASVGPKLTTGFTFTIFNTTLAGTPADAGQVNILVLFSDNT